MKRKIVSTKKAPEAIGPYSQAVRAGGLVFLSGQIPLDPETMEVEGASTAEQTERVFASIRAVLEAAGSSLADLVKVTVYMKDLSEFAEMNEVYGRYLSSEPPSRACVEVSRLPKDVLVEIDAVALVGR